MSKESEQAANLWDELRFWDDCDSYVTNVLIPILLPETMFDDEEAEEI